MRRAGAAFVAVVTLLAGMLAGPTSAKARSDASFGSAGFVIPNLQGDIRDIHQEANGSLIAAANLSDAAAIVRFNSDGSLDTSFGTLGVGGANLGGGRAIAVAPRASGGYWLTAGNGFRLVAFTADGAVDTSVGGGDGVVSLVAGANDYATVGTTDGLGRILVAGLTSVGGEDCTAVVRFGTDGLPDASFGSGGSMVVDLLPGSSEAPTAIGVDSAQRPIVAFSDGGTVDTISTHVTRLTANGALDTTFGTAGVVNPFGPKQWADPSSLVPLPSGRILVATGADKGIAVRRLTNSGQLDATFGSNGATLIKIGGRPAHVLMSSLADQSVLFGTDGFYTTRMTSSGQPDPLYPGEQIGFSGAEHNTAYALLVDRDGKFLMAGTSDPRTYGCGGCDYVSLAQYRALPPACTIVGTDRADTLKGTRRADVICGLGGDDVVRGLGGADSIYGFDGRDALYGGAGNDTLNGGPTRGDICVGGPGVDHFRLCERVS